VHVPPIAPRSDWDCSHEVPWWKDRLYRVRAAHMTLLAPCVRCALHVQQAHTDATQDAAHCTLRDSTLPAAAQVGSLSACVRPVRVRNMLTQQDDALEVPAEETIAEIRDRWAGAAVGLYGLAEPEGTCSSCCPPPAWLKLIGAQGSPLLSGSCGAARLGLWHSRGGGR
jgi:hypothetical protein